MNVKAFLPIPNILSCHRILCVQPHPDDNEVGAGGTIAKLARSGSEVTFLTATDGSVGSADPAVKPQDLAARRALEIEKAAALLGVKRCLSLGIADGSFPSDELLCRKIVGFIRELRPDLLVTCDPFLPYEAHPDHRGVGMAALEACIFGGFPNFKAEGAAGSVAGGDKAGPWSVPTIALYSSASPNVYFDVSDTWALKFEALAAHESQFPPEALARLKPYFELKGFQYACRSGHWLGAPLGKRRAEALKVMPSVCIHGFVDAATY
jgi:N,N'-diacetylchitobiose non-reducing end deacetylase